MEKANKALISGAPSQGGLDIEAVSQRFRNQIELINNFYCSLKFVLKWLEPNQ